MKFVNSAISTIADKGTPSIHNKSPLAILLSSPFPIPKTLPIGICTLERSCTRSKSPLRLGAVLHHFVWLTEGEACCSRIMSAGTSRDGAKTDHVAETRRPLSPKHFPDREPTPPPPKSRLAMRNRRSRNHPPLMNVAMSVAIRAHSTVWSGSDLIRKGRGVGPAYKYRARNGGALQAGSSQAAHGRRVSEPY